MTDQGFHDLGGGTPAGLLQARAAAAPDHLAVVFPGATLTYRELDDGATAVARALLSLGLEKGSAISLYLTNRPEYLIAYFGAARAGLRYVPVNIAYKDSFLRYALEHSETDTVITEAALLEPLSDLSPFPTEVKNVVVLDADEGSIPPFDGKAVTWEHFLSARDNERVIPDVGPGDIISISYTSGTTGRSKGVLTPALQPVVTAREAAEAIGTRSNDRVYTCLPLFHGASLVVSSMRAIYAGATVCLSPRFSASGFWSEVRAMRATELSALGSILPMLLAQPPSESDRDHLVERVFAAPARPEVLYRFERRFGVHIIEGYGASEIKNVIYNPVSGRKVGSLGLPTASSIIEVHDESGRAVPTGQVGEIVYRPRMANIMLRGYHGNDEATVIGMKDLWWHTGDLAYQDDDGFFYFVDRSKDALRRRGENVSSQEVEAALLLYPGVVDAAVVGVPSELGEDEIFAVCEFEEIDSVDYVALFKHCDRALPRYMVPRYFRAVEALPRTPTGKVRKVELKDLDIVTAAWDAKSADLQPTRLI